MDHVLTAAFVGKPLWMWLAFLAIVAVLLAFDLGVLHRKTREIWARESLLLSAFYIALGVGFGGIVWAQLGGQAGAEYLTGFVVEKSLEMDNVFVVALIFGYLAIPREYQHRVLFRGVLGVIVLRGIMIGLGATLVAEFSWILYLFAAFLVASVIKLLLWSGKTPNLSEIIVLKLLRRWFRVSDRLNGDRFFVRLPLPGSGRAAVYVTPLFLVLIRVEVTDLIFAVDSVPAIFAITTDAYVVYTSNIFAILGLRALYFALAAVLYRFTYLKQALALLLVFIGAKIFIADLFGWAKFPAEWPLAVTFAILAAGVAVSLWRTRGSPSASAADR